MKLTYDPKTQCFGLEMTTEELDKLTIDKIKAILAKLKGAGVKVVGKIGRVIKR